MIGNGEKMPIKHISKINIHTPKNKKLTLNKVLHVPKINKNLLSVSQLTSSNNVEVIFNSSSCFVKDKAIGKVLLLRKLKDGLYCLGSSRSTPLYHPYCQAFIASKHNQTPESRILMWHRRLVYPSSKTLAVILKTCNEPFKFNENIFCDACQLGKSHLLPYSLSLSNAKTLFKIVHIDVWGPSALPSLSRHRYFIIFIDDYSRFT